FGAVAVDDMQQVACGGADPLERQAGRRIGEVGALAQTPERVGRSRVVRGSEGIEVHAVDDRLQDRTCDSTGATAEGDRAANLLGVGEGRSVDVAGDVVDRGAPQPGRQRSVVGDTEGVRQRLDVEVRNGDAPHYLVQARSLEGREDVDGVEMKFRLVLRACG